MLGMAVCVAGLRRSGVGVLRLELPLRRDEDIVVAHITCAMSSNHIDSTIGLSVKKSCVVLHISTASSC